METNMETQQHGGNKKHAPVPKAKPLRAFIVEVYDFDDDGNARKKLFHRVGFAFPHKNGPGFNVVIPPGISVSGTIVVLEAPENEGEQT